MNIYIASGSYPKAMQIIRNAGLQLKADSAKHTYVQAVNADRHRLHEHAKEKSVSGKDGSGNIKYVMKVICNIMSIISIIIRSSTDWLNMLKIGPGQLITNT